jgi:hypothetical protein
MFKHLSFLAILSLAFATTSAWADPALLVPVTINTSSIAGTSGSLDFNFNPGPFTSQAASLEILNLTTDGTLNGAPFLTGDVSGGPLPTNVLFDNGTVFNDYFQDFTYGDELSFDVLFTGPAVTSPDGTSTSGSTFAFSMYSDPSGVNPVLTSDSINGFAFTTGVNLDGTVTPTNYSSQTNIGSPSPVPEPSPIMLLITAIAVICGSRYVGYKPGLQSS